MLHLNPSFLSSDYPLQVHQTGHIGSRDYLGSISYMVTNPVFAHMY